MSSKQRRAIAVVVAVGLLAVSVVAWWAMTPDTRVAAVSEPDLGPRPAASQRGRAVLARSGDAPTRRARAVPSPVPSPSERIRVVVVPLREGRIDRRTFVLSQLRPQDWLPTATEFGLAGDETAERLDDYLDGLGPMPLRGGDEGLHRVVQQAERDGFLPAEMEPDDPWMSLFRSTLAWMAGEAAYDQAIEEAAERFRERFGEGPYDGRPPLVNRDAEAAAFWADVVPPLDHADTLDLADAVVESFPEHPAADYARLLGMGVVMHVSAEQYDPVGAVDRALDAFESSSDPLVGEAAVATLSNGSRVQIDDDDVDVLLTAAEEHPHTMTNIAMFGMESAYASGELRAAAQWWQRLAESVEASCDCANPEPGSTCTHECRWVVDAEQQLVARGGMPARSWTAALRGLVQRCAWEVSEPADRFVGEAEWREGWNWTLLEPEQELAACVVAEAWDGPEPDDGTQVRVQYGRRAVGGMLSIPAGN